MKHRTIPESRVWEESIIRLLFTLLLFLSILRVIDMLPDANLVATPAFSETAPAQPVPMDEIDTPTPMCRPDRSARLTPAKACWLWGKRWRKGSGYSTAFL